MGLLLSPGLLGALRRVTGLEPKPAKACQVLVLFPGSELVRKPRCLAVRGHLPRQPSARASSLTWWALCCPLCP